MAAPALRNTIYSDFSDREFDADDAFDAPEFLTGERICPPRPRRGAVFKLLSWLVVLGALGGGWSLLQDPPTWLKSLSTDVAALWSALNPQEPQPAQQETAALSAPPPAAVTELPVASTEISDAPGAEAGTAVPSGTVETAPAGSSDTGAAASNETPTAPAQQQPSPPRTERYEKQAEAVGLNPDLSKAVLRRLSATDFRNAGIAIKTALAETADDAVHTWPNKPKPSVALFEVHFVPGAAENCRRYVVTVTKDRWSTTAPPMEKCGIGKPAPGVVKASAG